MSKAEYENGYNAGFQAGYQEARARYEHELTALRAMNDAAVKVALDIHRTMTPSVVVEKTVSDAAMYGVGMWKVEHVPVEMVVDVQKATLVMKCVGANGCQCPSSCTTEHECKLDALDRACDY